MTTLMLVCVLLALIIALGGSVCAFDTGDRRHENRTGLDGTDLPPYGVSGEFWDRLTDVDKDISFCLDGLHVRDVL